MRHRLWILAVASVMAPFILGQAAAQTPMAVPYATISAGQPSAVVQAGYGGSDCGACQGSGCGICGTPTPVGFRLANHLNQSACGCDTCGTGGSCGPAGCGPGLGGLGLGGGLAGIGMGQHLQQMNASRYGGYATQAHGEENGPFGGGGCCTPIWYDFHVEWMNLTREDVGDSTPFTSVNAGGPIVLSTDDLDLEDGNGFRATYALNFGPSSNLEASYFGTHEWDDAASVTGASNLYSVFSEFGTTPIDTQTNVIGFPDSVDQANLHSIAYASELHNVELNLRRRWVSANCLFHGSYLAGLRYVSLEESFNHSTQANFGGFLNYDVETQNDAVGFQIGGDFYVCLTPRFKLGVEAEGGIYSNDTKANTNVVWREGDPNNPPNSPVDSLTESEKDTDAAFVGELGAIGLFKVTPRLTLRGGYQMMFFDGMALATENFNTAAPLDPRAAFVRNNGDVFLHGATAGFTWMW